MIGNMGVSIDQKPHNSRSRRISMIFEPDGFTNQGEQLMGRQVAGHSFLSALLADRVDVACVTPNARSREHFSSFMKAQGLDMASDAFPATEYSSLEERGLFFTPDPNLEKYAYSRLRYSPSAYSICGVTHTTATHAMMDRFKNLPLAPLMPWDALISTSKSVKATIEAVLDAQGEYLSWRLGGRKISAPCELPIIPLGMNTSRFKYSTEFALAARQSLGIAQEEVVILFVGRLSPYTKANPLPMYLAASHAAAVTGKQVTVLECGWFESDQIGEHMAELRAMGLDGTKYLHHDGRKPDEADKCWAAADIFVSLSDNIQETFGLTPVEAMATGLPVIVSDWDGYKETVPDGIAGFRVPTLFPENTGTLAAEYETHLLYQRYCLRAASVTSVDLRVLNDRMVRLVEDGALRTRMGTAAREHAQRVFDWSVVLPQYYRLWDELEARRVGSGVDPAPACDPARLPPEQAFPTYPTAYLTEDTRLYWVEDFPEENFDPLKDTVCFQNAATTVPSYDLLAASKEALSHPTGMSCRELAHTCNLGDDFLMKISTAIKIGLLSTFSKRV